MSRNLFCFILMIIVAASADYAHADFTVLAGATRFGTPSDGTYWNVNQPHDFSLTSGSVGVRWDSERLPFDTSVAVQYTYFGKARTSALAVNLDAPHQGGYIPNSGGQCVGPCAPLSLWVMESEAQSVAFIGAKHFGDFSIEWGLNVYETLTRGYVKHVESANAWSWRYKPQQYLSTSQMIGLGYQRGKWSVRLQMWLMDGPYRHDKQEEAPAIFNQEKTWSLLVGYPF